MLTLPKWNSKHRCGRTKECYPWLAHQRLALYGVLKHLNRDILQSCQTSEECDPTEVNITPH
ncbi:rCG63418 [Rattus norvegicus]|uniref:RCG63418 n=1 Tax=Rattus norvegicus TaxID=10116 RepID=A6ILB7_RAT|nr:rCG63418 [Rattus norvegicus]